MIVPAITGAFRLWRRYRRARRRGREEPERAMVRQSGKAVDMTGKLAVLLPCACFFSETPLITATRYLGKNGQVFLEVITRAKYCAISYRGLRDERGNGGEEAYRIVVII
jgi:hypothetical protein